MIKVENLSKKYGDLVVLKNISTEIKISNHINELHNLILC